MFLCGGLSLSAAAFRWRHLLTDAYWPCRKPGTIDLVILDMGLPDLRGDKVYDRLRKVRCDQKIIVSTGYAVDLVARDLNLNANEVIQKPYDILTLSSRIQKVLKGT